MILPDVSRGHHRPGVRSTDDRDLLVCGVDIMAIVRYSDVDHLIEPVADEVCRFSPGWRCENGPPASVVWLVRKQDLFPGTAQLQRMIKTGPAD